MRLAILEDESEQSDLVSGWLREAGHQVRCFSRVAECRQALHRESFDILILDWQLPDGTGFELLKELRSLPDGRRQLVIFTTARSDEEDVAAALDAGADDYLAKPVRRRELLSRLDALWRRAGTAEPELAVLSHPPYRLDLDARICEFNGEPVALTEKEFDVAVFLFRNLGTLLSRGHILEAVWGIAGDISTRTVDTHVSRLRSKLALRPQNGLRLASIYNFGYRLEIVGAAESGADAADGP